MLRITPMQMQDTAKGTQAECADRVERLHKKTSCALSPKKHNIEKVNAKEVRANRVIKRNFYAVRGNS